MAVTMTKKITIEGSSVIDGIIAEGYRAVINSSNPADINMSSWQQDKTVYKNNHEQCLADRKEFETAAYAAQDELIAAAETETTEE